MLSGSPGRILDLSPAQAVFVDRGAIPSIVGSAAVVWGDELDGVPLPPIRRLDVAKAFLGLFNQVLFSAAVYSLLPGATRYAMDALKRSVHNCDFCHHAPPLWSRAWASPASLIGSPNSCAGRDPASQGWARR